MIIRSAKRSDIEGLIYLMQKADDTGKRSKEWAEEKANGFVAKRKKLIVIAEEDGRLAGYIGLREYEDNEARALMNLDDFAWVTWIAVMPEFRHRSVGTQLLKSADDFARSHGKLGVVLDCRFKILPFYIRSGYKVVGEYKSIDNITGKEVPQYVLRKMI